MLAPVKGAETRSTLKKLLKDWGGKLTDFSEEEANELSKLKDTLKAEMSKKA
jgi:gas vesicle protein